MTPGIYKIPKSALRNNWLFSFRDASNNPVSYASLIVHEDNLVTFNLSVRSTAAAGVGNLIAVLDLFKAVPIPPLTNAAQLSRYILGTPHFVQGYNAAAPFVPARMDYAGNLYVARAATANTDYYFRSTVSLING